MTAYDKQNILFVWQRMGKYKVLISLKQYIIW